MKCLAVFLVLIGLSLALPVERTHQLAAEAIFDLCCKYPGFHPLLCNSLICPPKNSTSRTTIAETERLSPQAQRSFSVKGQDIKTQDLSELLSNIPSIRRLATGLISNLANYVNQTKTDTTLADILNKLRKGSNNFDSVLGKSMPTVLKRIKEFLTGSDKSAPNESISTPIATSPPPTTRLPLATSPSPTPTLINVLSKLPSSIRGRLADLVRGIINENSNPQSQDIVDPTTPPSTIFSTRLNRCVSRGLAGKDLISCLTTYRANAISYKQVQGTSYETASSEPLVVEDEHDIIAKSQAEEDLLEELEEALNN